MAIQIDIEEREALLVEDAHVRPVMGLDILEPLPSARIPYRLADPFILVHEGVVRITREQASLDTSISTVGSTTSGMRSRAPRARVTAPVPAVQWSGRDWSQVRC